MRLQVHGEDAFPRKCVFFNTHVEVRGILIIISAMVVLSHTMILDLISFHKQLTVDTFQTASLSVFTSARRHFSSNSGGEINEFWLL